MIQAKKGICIDCVDSVPRYLMAKRCEYHYKKHRKKVNENNKTGIARKERKAKLNVFFAAQILLIPRNCENCDTRLMLNTSFNRRAAVCHIVEKEHYRTVETHPLNRWFGCLDCHTQYDRQGHDNQENMAVAPIVIERFKQFMHLLTPLEVKRLPAYLERVYNGDS